MPCPPNPDATCTCGEPLEKHEVPMFGGKPVFTTLTLICPEPVWVGEWPERDFPVAREFEVVDGETTDCPDVETCSICGQPVCPEHDDDAILCDRAVHHADEGCPVCDDIAREDAAHERADQIRKGEWDD